MKIELAYGKKGLEFEMPSQAKPVVIRKPPFEILEDSSQVIREALENPIGIPSLEALASKASSACILICDITRPVPNGLFLRPLMKNWLKEESPWKTSPCWWQQGFIGPTSEMNSGKWSEIPGSWKSSKWRIMTPKTMNSI